LCGYPPFSGKSSKDVLAKIKRGKVEFDFNDWKHISNEALDLIVKMLTVDIADRISIDDALEHKWFKD
jgi:calcium-dependent protein kinase